MHEKEWRLLKSVMFLSDLLLRRGRGGSSSVLVFRPVMLPFNPVPAPAPALSPDPPPTLPPPPPTPVSPFFTLTSLVSLTPI